MISHETIKKRVAKAVYESAAVKAFCIEKFGKPLNVIVNRYGDEGYPGEKDAPFAFFFSDGENESGAVEENTFEFVCVCGAVEPAEAPRYEERVERTETENGFEISGMAADVEELREMIYEICRGGNFGAIFRSAERTESNMADYPLEWAKMRLAYYEPETIS